MDRLIDLKQCTESYYNNNPSSLIEDVFALLNLITKASRIIKEYDELQNLSTTKNKINNENIKKELEYWNNISTFFKNRVSETSHLPINNFYPQPTTYLQNNEKGWNPIYADIDNLFIRDVI